MPDEHIGSVWRVLAFILYIVLILVKYVTGAFAINLKLYTLKVTVFVKKPQAIPLNIKNTQSGTILFIRSHMIRFLPIKFIDLTLNQPSFTLISFF